MDYYACYDNLLSFFPKDPSYLIIQYCFAKCHDCNDMYVDEYYECECNILRCKHHNWLNTTYYNNSFNCDNCGKIDYKVVRQRSYNICIICTEPYANFGYNDIICVCDIHKYFRKIINYCPLYKKRIYRKKTCYSDTTTSLYNNSGKQCSFCQRKCFGLRSCKCKKYCSYCFVMCAWSEHNEYVCNDCCGKNINEKTCLSFTLDIHIICHQGDCTENAVYGCYGILLFCWQHDCKALDLIPMFSACKSDNCYKLVVDSHDNCYDHTTNKIRTQIQYMIS